MVRDQYQSPPLDAPGFELREEVHAEHVQIPKTRRGDDPQVAGDDVADAKLVHLAGLRGRRAVRGAQDDRRQAGARIDSRLASSARGNSGDRRAAVDQHSPLNAIDYRKDPEMA